jgi:hypothetical protein
LNYHNHNRHKHQKKIEVEDQKPNKPNTQKAKGRLGSLESWEGKREKRIATETATEEEEEMYVVVPGVECRAERAIAQTGHQDGMHATEKACH